MHKPTVNRLTVFKWIDLRAVAFHETSGCAAVTVVLWLALSKETSPLIVVIHHLQRAHVEIIRPFISCSKWDQLRCIRYWTSEKLTLIFDSLCWCWNRLTIDSEWSKMLQATCRVAHNSCSCSSNVLSWIFLDICFMIACSLWRDFHRRNTNLKH